MLSRARKQKLLKQAQESNEPTVNTPKSMKSWFKPYPHQAAAVNRLLSNDGNLILAHEVGTGKTVSGILGFEKLKEEGKARKAIVVVPAGLRENFARGGLEKFLNKPNFQIIGSTSEKGMKDYVRPNAATPDKNYTIVSYAMFLRNKDQILQQTGADTLIFDEFHRARNESGGVFQNSVAARKQVRNFIGLTGSLVSNSPGEIASLLNISTGTRYMSPSQFKQRYTKVVGYETGFGGKKKQLRGIQRKPELVTLVDPRVHYMTSKELQGKSMPRKDISFVDVPMSREQYSMYNLAMDKVGPAKELVMRRDPSVIVKDIDPSLVFAQLAHARQISNSMAVARQMPLEQAAQVTPKVKKLIDDTISHLQETPDGKVIVYSNLIRGGVDVLDAGLRARGLDPALFVGKGTEIGKNKVTTQTRTKGVSDFKAGKKKVIIISGAGAEGLNLPNATAFHALDGHFNPERILQAEARGRRLGGQSHRPPEQRKIQVRRYRNVAPPGIKDRTTDQWVYDTARRKYMQNQEFYQTIQKPTKYIRKFKDPMTGKWRYEYPKQPGKPRMVSKAFTHALTPKAPRVQQPN